MVIYLDGADLSEMAKYAPPLNMTGWTVEGFTTNPSLMRKAGIGDYRAFAKAALACANGKPVSFEVFADDHPEMARQAREIATWGNVYVKVPVVNSLGESSAAVIKALADSGIRVNVTAVFTEDQVREAAKALGESESIISIFAGRIADAGIDPTTLFYKARYWRKSSNVRTLWASVREVYNVVQADNCQADIITLAPELMQKLGGIGRDLTECSLATVQQFKRDAEGMML